MLNPRSTPDGNSGRETGVVQFSGSLLKVLDVYHACCSQCLQIVLWVREAVVSDDVT